MKKILIDGDACGITGKITARASNKRFEVHIYCDTNHMQHYNKAVVHYVDQGRDSADWALLKAVAEGDVVYTADAGLASLCIVKGAAVYNYYGVRFSENDINAALMSRYIRNSLRRRSRKGNGYNRKRSVA